MFVGISCVKKVQPEEPDVDGTILKRLLDSQCGDRMQLAEDRI
jgi:hypothetical protein